MVSVVVARHKSCQGCHVSKHVATTLNVWVLQSDFPVLFPSHKTFC